MDDAEPNSNSTEANMFYKKRNKSRKDIQSIQKRG